MLKFAYRYLACKFVRVSLPHWWLVYVCDIYMTLNTVYYHVNCIVCQHLFLKLITKIISRFIALRLRVIDLCLRWYTVAWCTLCWSSVQCAFLQGGDDAVELVSHAHAHTVNDHFSRWTSVSSAGCLLLVTILRVLVSSSLFFLSFSLTLHIHLIVLISVQFIFISCCTFVGQLSLPYIRQLTQF